MLAVLKHKQPDQNILTEQVKMLYRTLLPIAMVTLVVSTALVYGLWNVVSNTALIVWLALMLFVIVLRVVKYFIFRRYFTPKLARQYALYFVIGTGLTGMIWGASGVFLFPEQALEYQLLILFVLVGMGAGAVGSLTIYMPAFYAFFPVSMIPVTINLLFTEETVTLSLGIMTIAYIAGLSYLGLNINRSMTESFKLRFENIDLLEQLREQKEEAEQANMATSKFLAAASHDLRQPLHALTLFTSVLDESIQYPKVRKVVDQIKASVAALQNLFNALLDISRLDAGVMKVEKTDFTLQPMLDKIANDVNPQASEKGLRILWPTCPYAVHTDQTLLEQILRNYISNAIRYTYSGEINITYEAKQGKITISVTDTGPGIPEQEQQVIFDEFHQLNNPERDRSKGLGLGLAIVQRTAKLLGHDIGVESQSGKGSTFFITVDQANLVESTHINATEIEDDIQQVDSPLIMVIDDEASVREGTQNLLELWGYEVITAADQDEAIALLKQQGRAPDGIIADYRLRENRSGVEAIHAIYSEYNSDIPALIITGDTAPKRLREVSDSGFQMLHKPVAPAKLRAFLRHVQLRN